MLHFLTLSAVLKDVSVREARCLLSVGEERISIWKRYSILFSSEARGYSQIPDDGARVREHSLADLNPTNH